MKLLITQFSPASSYSVTRKPLYLPSAPPSRILSASHQVKWHQPAHCSTIYVYSLIHSCYMFRRYYLAIFRELTPQFF